MGDGAAGDLLDLLVEHLDGGLGLNDVVTDHDADGDQQPPKAALCQAAAKQAAHRSKADVDAGEEQNQTDVCIQKTDAHTQNLPLAVVAGEQLEDHKHADDGKHADQHLMGVLRDGHQELMHHIVGGLDGGDLHRGVDCLGRVVEDAQQQHHQDGSDAAQRDKAEAVVGAVLVAAGGGKTDTQRQDEGDGHRAGGDAARVKRDGNKVRRGEKGE